MVLLCLPSKLFVRPQRRVRRSSLLSKMIEPDISLSDIEGEADIPTLRNTIKSLPEFLKNKVFILSVLGIANLSFVITVIQFWGSDYMIKVLFIPTSHSSIAYIIDCLLAPSIGVIVGGVIIKWFGGYEKLNTSYLVLVAGISASLLTIPIPFVNSLYGYNGLLFGVLIFGGIAAPAIIGIILNSVPLHQRAIASSIMLIFCNLLGYIPAPFLYGLIYDYTSDENPKLANAVCMYFSVFGAIFVIFSVMARRKLFSESNCNDEDETNSQKKKSFSISKFDSISQKSILSLQDLVDSNLQNSFKEEPPKVRLECSSCEVKSSSPNPKRMEV